MPYQATVYNVMIASPGDVEAERAIVRGVVNEWNVVNAASRRTILVPVGWETHSSPLMGDRPQEIINRQVLKDADLLIATFWTRIGTPTGKAPSGTVEEIESHIAAGRPAMLYFSSAPVVPDSLDGEQYDALKAFKVSCKPRGLFQSYTSLGEFHSLVRSHLGRTINEHPYFAPARDANGAGPSSREAAPSVPRLSKEAVELLLAAAEGDGRVMTIATLDGRFVQANRRQFVDAKNPRSEAIWRDAVSELAAHGLLKPAGLKGQVHEVTRKGFELADLLRPLGAAG